MPGTVWRSLAMSGVHLFAGNLAAFAGLGALGHLDLDLRRRGKICRRDAKAARRHLFHGAVSLGAKARPDPRRPRRSRSGRPSGSWRWPASRGLPAKGRRATLAPWKSA